jgi:effector-binding domain-containing protein
VESGSGYRYYDQRNVDTARTIVALRGFGFGLDEVAEILRDHSDEADILSFLEKRKQTLNDRVARDRELVSSIDRIIQREMEARQMSQQTVFEIEEKTLQSILIAGIRMKGRYEDCGKGFAKIGRSLGRHISGKCLCLYYDGEFRDEDADFEPCMPVRKLVRADGIDVRELPGGRCVALVHRGAYNELGRSYERLIKYVKEQGYAMQLPTREVYLKGPGMIFKGNPKKYLTEIQILIGDGGNDA